MFLVQGLAITLAFDSDMLVVSNVLGAEEAGVYGLNLRVVTMVGAFALSGFSQLFPAFGEALSGGDNEWVRNALRRLTCWLATYSVAVALILFWMEPIFVHEWVGEALVSSKSLLLALIVWGAYTTVLIPVNMFLNAALVIRMQIFTAIAMAAVNLPLSIALARSIGVSGPAWGSLIAHVSVSLVPTIIVARRLLAKTRPV
jgi:O-antigen/teichoic acid export membrane protein